MKTLLKLLFFVACLGLIITCDKSEEIFEEMPDAELKSGKMHTVTVPFKADFTVWGQKPEHNCGDYFSIHMKGNGNITHLGKMSTVMTFCSDGMGNYWDTDVLFVAANGDELYATIPVGLIVPNEEDNAAFYSFRFNDTIYFDDGTGRFEGAKGKALTHAYVHYPFDEWRHKGDSVWHTDFFSKGELILKKGKK